MKIRSNLTCIFLLIPIIMFSQAESLFNGVQLEESVEAVTKKMTSISGKVKLVNVEKPSFPLAKNKETHLICSNVTTENGTIAKVIFTFADDRLSYIEARGDVLKVLTGKRMDTAKTYMDYEVYFKDKLFLNKKKDIAWIMNEGCIHANLFTWENPYLNPDHKIIVNADPQNKIPEFLEMGESIDDLRPVLEAHSKFIQTEELDGSDPNAQVQINCFGVDYAGFPRKIEARFGNDKLNVVWILTGKGEEDRIRQALTAQYGDPIYINDDWEIFNNWQVGLRKDKPEVLLMTRELGLEYKTSYFKQ